jgi:hypothetical protein
MGGAYIEWQHIPAKPAPAPSSGSETRDVHYAREQQRMRSAMQEAQAPSCTQGMDGFVTEQGFTREKHAHKETHVRVETGVER